jgi:hypothetical protein
VQGAEPVAVARQRAAAAAGAAPRRVGVDVEEDDGVALQQLAHARGRDGAAAERDDRGVVALEQVAHDVLLERPERALAVAGEVGLDRRAEARLDLVVGVDRAAAERGRCGAGGRRLAGAHEADEDERAYAVRRVHPIRFS